MKSLKYNLLSVMLTLCLAPHVAPAQSLPKIPPAMKLNDPLPANLFVELARVMNPSVVNISTSAILRRGNRDPFFDMLEQLYGFQQMPRPQAKRPQQMALGSGFIIRDDGLIVTNAHVVRGADIINVQLTEKAEKLYEARVVGSDDRSDIALIKIKPDRPLQAAAMGTSKDTQVGEWVAAFGNPFGHGHTMTKGVISSKEREIAEINKFPLLQTDASINPGNSGGPLVDSRGYVIGVNSAIDARAQGIGFAIPIDEVKKILPELETRGNIRKGYIGVGLGEMDPQAAEAYDISGSVIMEVENGGPAFKAKLKTYDVITEFNGKKIRSSADLINAVADAPIGTKVKVKYLRQQGEKFNKNETEITVVERPSKPMARTTPNLPLPQGKKAPHNLGMTVGDLNSDLRERMGLAKDLVKPVVLNVENGSVAAFVGIQVGDLILDVNKKEVTTADDVMKEIKAGENTLRLARGNRIIVITVSAK